MDAFYLINITKQNMNILRTINNNIYSKEIWEQNI
jgi:hypothetical protein